MFHRVVLPKNVVEFYQEFNSNDSFSLAMLYDLVQHRMIILAKRLINIVYLFVVIFVYLCK